MLPSSLTIIEMPSPNYARRTKYNAEMADLTCACAVDFDTTGERVTKEYARDRYMSAELRRDPIYAARNLYKQMRERCVGTLNIAGNGLHVLSRHGIAQKDVNVWMHTMLSLVHKHYPINKLISGGQSGVDISAAVVGSLLGIPTIVHFPKGYKQRLASGLDVDQSLDDVVCSINEMKSELIQHINE